MAIQTYGSPAAGRLGKMAGQIIAHAINSEVLSGACQQLDMPKNKSDTMVVRSWVPYGGTVSAPNTWTVTAEAHITSEGVTPTADTIVPRDVTFTLNQYAALYALTDKDYDLHEDDIAMAMKEQTGERMGLVREMALYGKMKACTNKFYAGGTTRLTVDETVSDSFISSIVRSLNANHAKFITKVLSPANLYGSTSVDASYVCYVHSDMEYDIERLPNFRSVANYGNRQLISDYELGCVGKVRFVLSPELYPYLNSGATASGTGLATSSTLVNVYPMIFMAKDAFAQVKLRGQDALKPTFLPPGMSDKNDPLGQRGYIGAKFWHACEVLNSGWMAVGEAGITSL